MRVEFAIKNWINQRLNSLSGFVAGKDFRAIDVKQAKNIVEILNKSQDSPHVSPVLLQLFGIQKRIMGPFGENISKDDLMNLSKELVEEYKSIIRDYKLKHLLEFNAYSKSRKD